MCVSPYIAKKKTGELVAVPCGKCIECRVDYQNEWIFRLTQECKRAPCPAFITLTLDDRNVILGDSDEGVQSIVLKSEFQKFMKRLRKNGGSLLKDCRYFAVGEYGSKKNRSHYHAVIIAPSVNITTLRRLVAKSWTFGFVKVKLALKKQIHYVAKYMNKLDERPHLLPPFRLYSRGLGLCYLSEKIVKYYLTTFDRTCISGKFRIKLPRYYQRKLDEFSAGNPFLKRAGLTYSDMKPDYNWDKDSKEALFEYFIKNYDDCYKSLVPKVQTGVDALGDPVYQYVRQFTVNEVFTMYCNRNKFLSNIRNVSDRKLENCVIRNQLRNWQPVSPEFIEDI